jgi:hypothetical protein
MGKLLEGNVIKLSIQALILEETLLKKGFFQTIFPKLLKVLGNRDPLWRGFKGKTLLEKGFPLKLMTLSPEGRGRKCAIWPRIYRPVYLDQAGTKVPFRPVRQYSNNRACHLFTDQI